MGSGQSNFRIIMMQSIFKLNYLLIEKFTFRFYASSRNLLKSEAILTYPKRILSTCFFLLLRILLNISTNFEPLNHFQCNPILIINCIKKDYFLNKLIFFIKLLCKLCFLLTIQYPKLAFRKLKFPILSMKAILIIQSE